MKNTDIPADGIIKLNNGTQIKVRLREDENNKLKLEILDKPSNINHFHGDLKGHFEINGDSLNITFLNCNNHHPQQYEIEFSHHIEYWDFGNPNNTQYIDLHSKRKELCFRIENIKLWLYPRTRNIYDNLWSYVDNHGNKVKSGKDADFIKIKVGNKSNEYEFTYQNNKFILSIIDEFQSNFLKYPDVNLYPSCYLKLSSEKELPVQYLYRLILKIQKLFSLFFNQVANLTSISEVKQFDYFIKYDILRPNHKSDIFVPYFNIDYEAVSQNLGSILQKWFEIYDEYEMVIDSICSYEISNVLSYEISKKAQLLETFGNIINKGASTRSDIKVALSQLNTNTFNKIFEQSEIKFDFDINELGNTSEQQISNLSEQIMNLRNHSIHPYKSGKLKTPADDKIIKPFASGDDLDIYAIDTLTQCLSKVFIALILQKLDIDNLYNIL